MGTLTIPNTFVTGATIAAAEHNSNFSAITTVVNGNIDATNIKDAGVTNAKLATGLSLSKFQAVCAFRAQLSSDQGIDTAATNELIKFDSEDFDVTGVYDNAVEYEWTPTTAGIYAVSAFVTMDSPTSTTRARNVLLIKNSTDGTDGTTLSDAEFHDSDPQRAKVLGVSALVSMNGSTDQLRVYASSTVTDDDVIKGGTGLTYFEAHLIGTT